jgi:uncharacterized protein (DUF1778 family)
MRLTGPGSCPPSPAPLQFCLRENSTSTSTSTSAKRGDRNLIDRAAKTRGKNRTDFILEEARRAAEDALLYHIIISASPEACSEFLARLDMPPKTNERLRKTMQIPAPWAR